MTDIQTMIFYRKRANAIMEYQVLGGAITPADVRQLLFCVRIMDQIVLKCLRRGQRSRNQGERYAAALGLAGYETSRRYAGWN